MILGSGKTYLSRKQRLTPTKYAKISDFPKLRVGELSLSHVITVVEKQRSEREAQSMESGL